MLRDMIYAAWVKSADPVPEYHHGGGEKTGAGTQNKPANYAARNVRSPQQKRGRLLSRPLSCNLKSDLRRRLRVAAAPDGPEPAIHSQHLTRDPVIRRVQQKRNG
jgi:hypothetical protein